MWMRIIKQIPPLPGFCHEGILLEGQQFFTFSQTQKTWRIWKIQNKACVNKEFLSMFIRCVKKPSVRRLAGTSRVHGLSLKPIMQERCGDWVISLNRLPGKATGSLLGPSVSTRGKKTPSPPSDCNADKKKPHWWHHHLLASQKNPKTSHWTVHICTCGPGNRTK